MLTAETTTTRWNTMTAAERESYSETTGVSSETVRLYGKLLTGSETFTPPSLDMKCENKAEFFREFFKDIVKKG